MNKKKKKNIYIKKVQRSKNATTRLQHINFSMSSDDGRMHSTHVSRRPNKPNIIAVSTLENIIF